MSDSYIYFVKNESNGLIKIGFSRLPSNRIAELKSIEKSELALLGCMEGSMKDEFMLQRVFKKHCVKGEWFNPHSDILEFIAENTSTVLPQKPQLEIRGKQALEIPSIRELENATYEAITDAAREAVGYLDNWRWYIGDAAKLVGKRYGDDLIDDFAKQVGVSKSAAKQYRRVSSFYTMDTRVSFEDTNITYSHFRVAIRARINYMAIDWLNKASDNGWTVDELAAQMSESGIIREFIFKDTKLDPVLIDELRLLNGEIYLSVWREKEIEKETSQ